MKIEKDGIIKELVDEFMLADYMNAGWKIVKEQPFKEEKPFKEIKFKRDSK